MVRAHRSSLLCTIVGLFLALPLFADTLTASFTAGTPKGWRLPETAAVADGVLTLSGTGSSWAYWEAAGVGDLKLTFLYMPGKGTADIAFRADPQTATAYHLRFGPEQVEFTREFQKNSVSLSKVEMYLPSNWHAVTLVATEGRIAVYISEKPVLEATDPKPLGKGIIGLGVDNGVGIGYRDPMVSRQDDGAAPADVGTTPTDVGAPAPDETRPPGGVDPARPDPERQPPKVVPAGPPADGTPPATGTGTPRPPAVLDPLALPAPTAPPRGNCTMRLLLPAVSDEWMDVVSYECGQEIQNTELRLSLPTGEGTGAVTTERIPQIQVSLRPLEVVREVDAFSPRVYQACCERQTSGQPGVLEVTYDRGGRRLALRTEIGAPMILGIKAGGPGQSGIPQEGLVIAYTSARWVLSDANSREVISRGEWMRGADPRPCLVPAHDPSSLLPFRAH